ncbi:MAG: hypothetical protein AAB935_01810 [Patescibacteria group bacterium]
MDWKTFLTVFHVIGTALGVGGATFAEFFYLKSVRDGAVDPMEDGVLKITFYVLRIGMIFLVLSGFGFLLFYRLTGQEASLYNPKFLAKLTIILILFLGAIFWQAKKVPLWLGGAGSLTSWYAALILGVWRGLEASYLNIMLFYFLAVLFIAFLLGILRKLAGIKP